MVDLYGTPDIRTSGFFPELRSVLYAGGTKRSALHFGPAQRDSCPDYSAHVYVSWYHMVGISETQ